MFSSEAVLSALVGLVGALVGAGIAWMAAVSVAKWSRTMDLHREFNSERLSKARSEAASLLKKNWDTPFLALSETDDLAVPLWEVVYFYERLWTLVRYKQVASRVVPDLFAEVFLWWYCVSFRQQLVPGSWKSSRDIPRLYDWLKSNTDPAQWATWLASQEKAYSEWRAKYPIERGGTPG